jgi:adenylate kinase
MNIVLLGPPGTNKKIISNKLSKELNIMKLSTGAICNYILEDKNHPYHQHIIDSFQNDLINDQFIKKIIDKQLIKPNDGIILSGFPKTIEQAKYIDRIFLRSNKIINHVFYLDYDDETIINKIYGRSFCNHCHHSFVSSINNSCKICGNELIKDNFKSINNDNEVEQNIDDIEQHKLLYASLIKEKIESYKKNIIPVLSYYIEQNKIVRIKLIGNESIDSIVFKIIEYME